MLLTRYLAPMDTCVRWTLNFMLENCTSYMLLRSTKNLIPLMVNISYWDNLKRFHKFFFPDKDRKQNKMRTYAGLFFQIFSNTFVWSLSLFFCTWKPHSKWDPLKVSRKWTLHLLMRWQLIPQKGEKRHRQGLGYAWQEATDGIRESWRRRVDSSCPKRKVCRRSHSRKLQVLW